MDWNNKNDALKAVKQNGLALEYASDELKNDKEVVLAAVKQYGRALEYASDRLKDDKEVVLAAIEKYGYASAWASERLNNDKEVVLAAVKQYWAALEYASDELQSDKDVLNSMREYLINDKCKGHYDEQLFLDAKENLLKYDREDELQSKLADLDKLQARKQNFNNQSKVEVRTKRKV